LAYETVNQYRKCQQ